MRPVIGLALAMSLLTGCATARSSPVVVCVPVATYSPEFLNRAADELDHLPADSALEQMIADYQTMRAQARACSNASGAA